MSHGSCFFHVFSCPHSIIAKPLLQYPYYVWLRFSLCIKLNHFSHMLIQAIIFLVGIPLSPAENLQFQFFWFLIFHVKLSWWKCHVKDLETKILIFFKHPLHLCNTSVCILILVLTKSKLWQLKNTNTKFYLQSAP